MFAGLSIACLRNKKMRYRVCLVIFTGNGTARDLGMQSGEIKDTQITVSSVAHRSDAVYARINHHIINVAESKIILSFAYAGLNSIN